MATVASNRKRRTKFSSSKPTISRHSSTKVSNGRNRSPMATVASNRKRRTKFSSSKSTISRHSSTKVSIGREYHIRCRGFQKFKLLVSASFSKKKVKDRDCSSNEETSLCSGLRLNKKDDDNVHDSSIGDVLNGKNGKNLRVSLLPHVEKVSPEPFIPLTKDELAEVNSAFSRSNRMQVLVSHKSIDIRGEKLQCLMPGRWLNDELSSSGYNYQAVKRWISRRELGYDLIDCDIIFVPIHGGGHWTLAVINIRERKFLYLDPLDGVAPTILTSLAKYLVDEVKDKSGKHIDVRSWDFAYVKDLPQQQNGFDCGMFMLKYIDFYSRGLSLQFSQKHMPYFRLRTANEILRLRAN